MTGSTPDRGQVSERLLTAWRGEVLAAKVYELIARRLPDRQADLVSQIAQVEEGTVSGSKRGCTSLEWLCPIRQP